MRLFWVFAVIFFPTYVFFISHLSDVVFDSCLLMFYCFLSLCGYLNLWNDSRDNGELSLQSFPTYYICRRCHRVQFAYRFTLSSVTLWLIISEWLTEKLKFVFGDPGFQGSAFPNLHPRFSPVSLSASTCVICRFAIAALQSECFRTLQPFEVSRAATYNWVKN